MGLRLSHTSRIWWPMPVIPTHRETRQEDPVFEASTGFKVKPPFQQNKTKIRANRKVNHLSRVYIRWSLFFFNTSFSFCKSYFADIF